MRNDFIKYLTDNNTNPIDYFGPVDVYTEEFPGDYEEDNDDLWGDEDNIYDELDFVQPHKKTKVNLKITSIADDEVNEMKKFLKMEERIEETESDLNNPKDREQFFSALEAAMENEKKMAKFYIDKADGLDDIPLFGMDPHDKEEIDECYAESRRHLQLYEWLKDYKSLLSSKPKIKSRLRSILKHIEEANSIIESLKEENNIK